MLTAQVAQAKAEMFLTKKPKTMLSTTISPFGRQICALATPSRAGKLRQMLAKWATNSLGLRMNLSQQAHSQQQIDLALSLLLHSIQITPTLLIMTATPTA